MEGSLNQEKETLKTYNERLTQVENGLSTSQKDHI